MSLDKILFFLVSAGLATAGFGMMFRTQYKSLLPGAVIAGIGYVLYEMMMQATASAAVASFAAAVFVGLASEIAARKLKSPAVVFTTMGVIPLVPGAWLYRTMLHIVNADYATATAVGLETIMIAGAIALALGFSTVMARSILRTGRKNG